MKKLLTAIASTVVVSMGFAPTARAFFGFSPSGFSAPPPSIFPAAQPPPPSFSPPPVPSLFTPPAQVSQPTEVEYCKISNPIGAVQALSNPAKLCVASSVPEAFGRLTTFTMGNPQPAIEAAQCLKNSYPQDYNKALEFVDMSGDCKIYGD
ncbi:hypothetical protein [Dapis sp. BLCC M172]|uniref:hypothetical protein n=1 Tax=Dapis sp. BLCC M172 TaxID=2975281 RepID=UPI003CEE6C6E